MRLWIVFFTVLLFSSSLKAQSFVPEEQWTSETKLWLARAMVSEADWSKPDHAAIAWTLFRRWEQHHARDDAWTLLAQIKAYCAGFRATHSRSRWVLALEGEDKPIGWKDEEASWEVYRPAWLRVRAFVEAWGEGRVRDPCRGQASHWGGTMDRPSKGSIPVDCGQTLNIFYRRAPR